MKAIEEVRREFEKKCKDKEGSFMVVISGKLDDFESISVGVIHGESELNSFLQYVIGDVGIIDFEIIEAGVYCGNALWTLWEGALPLQNGTLVVEEVASMIARMVAEKLATPSQATLEK